MQQRRIASLLLITILGVVGLCVRLFDISILQHSTYVALAAQQQHVERDVLPRRGQVIVQDAAAGTTTVVAKSVESYALSATPKFVVHKADYAHLLAQASGMDEQLVLSRLQASSGYMPPLKHGMTKADVEDLVQKVNDLEKAYNPHFVAHQLNFDTSQGSILYFVGGVFFVREYRRVYPEGALLSQVLGFVNSTGQGQYGFEEQYNQQLEGYSGKLFLEQDSRGNLLQQSGAISGQNGEDFELSIDRNIQYEVEQKLQQEVQSSESHGGAVIVMDPKNGEIIAMASNPSYDPSNYRAVPSDQQNIFANPAISGAYEPGSIMKPINMAGAIDEGLVTPDTSSTFAATVNVDGHEIHTALNKAYGTETMTDVLANSDNVAMVWVTDKMGNQNVHDNLAKFGFGSMTGIDVKGETEGILPPLKGWRNINRATISFGQGISVTPLQVVSAYATIANGGTTVTPHVVRAAIDPNGTRHVPQYVVGHSVVKSDTAKQILGMMVATVNQAHRRAGTNGYLVAGKTGTAQVPDASGGYLDTTYNHSFVGIVPADNPKYVVLVVLDQPNIAKVGNFAESTAVPLFKSIDDFLINYYQIPPSGH